MYSKRKERTPHLTILNLKNKKFQNYYRILLTSTEKLNFKYIFDQYESTDGKCVQAFQSV